MTSISAPTIVVGIDGSSESQAALRWALRHAGSETTVEVVNCWQAQTLRDLAFGSSHELQNASNCMLDNEIAAAARDIAIMPTVRQSSVNGRPATVLTSLAQHAELLVLGAHGHTNMRDILFGQIEASCRRRAAAVVVVDADGHAIRHEASHRSATSV